MFFDRVLTLVSLKSRLLNSSAFSQLFTKERLPLRSFRKEGAMLSPLIAGLLAACGGGGGGGVLSIGGDGGRQQEGNNGGDGRSDDRLVGGSGADYFVLQVTEDITGLDRIVDFEAGIDKIILNMRPTDSEHIKKSHEFDISNQVFVSPHGNYDEFVIRERIADQRNPPIVHIVDGEKSIGQGPEKLLDNVFFFSSDITSSDAEFTDLFVKFIDGL